MTSEIGADTTLLRTIQQVFPGITLGSAGGWLQLFVELFFIAAGMAAATFVSRWASDENDGRLEEVLAAPLPRWRWVVSGASAGFVSVVIMAGLFVLGVGLGAGTVVDSSSAMLGSVSLGLYALALVGVGIAVGGVWRTSLAAEVVALLVVLTYLLDLLVPPLNLPGWLHELALTAHFGEPMVGSWDLVGVVACLVLFVGGTIVGAWGIRRRDVAR
jgi:ABC-2 type transport system permease protein